jgi:hypothetical protein
MTKDDMNKDDIIKLARESGWDDHHSQFDTRIERFANLVAEHEREECAKLCETPIDEIQITDDCAETVYMDATECAEAIRARGNT